MGRRRVSGFSPSAYQWCGGSGARRCRFRSTGSQRTAPHGDFGNPSIDRPVRVRPGHRAGRGARPQTAAHQDAASAAPARRTVRRLPSRSARRPRRRVEWAGRARARRPAAVRSPGPTGRCDPWGDIVPGPHRTPEPGPRSRIPRFSQRPEPDGEALPAVQNHFVLPVGLCARRRSGYGSIVTAWSRGTAISIGPGAAGMAWHGGRTTGQAGPV